MSRVAKSGRPEGRAGRREIFGSGEVMIRDDSRWCEIGNGMEKFL
jgi:hypothetical protein